jgi:hypothetical protein
MRRAILSLGLIAVISSIPVSAQDEIKGKELFPFAPFNVWTYRIQGQDDKLTVNVFETKEKEKNGERIYRLEGRLRNQAVVSEHLSLRKDGAYRLRHDNVEIDPPLLICRFPPVKGDTWKAEYKINDKKISVTYYCDRVEITHRDKKVMAVVIRAVISDGGDGITNTCWYVPGDGMVKQAIEEGDGQIVLEFENYGRPVKSKSP